MKTKKWLGLYTAGSPYDSPFGSSQIQENVQIVLPGRLAPRQGLVLEIGEYDETVAFGLYRITFGDLTEDTLFAYVRTNTDGTFRYELAVSAEQVVEDDLTNRYDAYLWSAVKTIDNGGDYFPSFCEDRNKNVYIFWGHGIAPQVRLASEEIYDIGLSSPQKAPVVAAAGQGYFLERIDVIYGGGSYPRPPTVTITGGGYDRQAQARAVIENGNVSYVEVVDGGKGYTSTPRIAFDDSSLGTGFEALCTLATVAEQWGLSNTEFFVGNNSATPHPSPVAYSPTVTGSLSAASVHAAAGFSATNPQISYAEWFDAQAVTAGVTGGTDFDIADALGIEAGDLVTFNLSPAKLAVTAVTNNTITVNQNVTLSIGDIVTFLRPRLATAERLAATQEYQAVFPLTSIKTTGSDASTVLKFEDSGTAYETSSADFRAEEIGLWVTGTSHNYYESTGSYTNWGLMSSHSQMRKGWEDYINESRVCDKFWGVAYNCRWAAPIQSRYFADYSKVSYYLHTGLPNTKTIGQYTLQEGLAVEPNSSFQYYVQGRWKYVDITLQPTLRPDGSPYELRPDAVLPVIRVKLAVQPDEFVRNWSKTHFGHEFVGGADAGPLVWRQPTAGQANPSYWGTSLHKALVDLYNPNPTSSLYAGNESYKNNYGYGVDTITLENPGSNLPYGAEFRVRFCLSKANHEQSGGQGGAINRDFSTAPYGNTFAFDFDNRFYEFSYTANTVSTTASTAGPPDTLVTTLPSLNSSGNGYGQGSSAGLILLQRPEAADWTYDPTDPATTWDISYSFTWDSLLLTATKTLDYIESVTILNNGQGYYNPPTILQTSSSGGGAVFDAYVDDYFENGNPNTYGAITRIGVADGGTGYTAGSLPRLYTSRYGARALPVLRPSMKGVYRCTYRYVDRSTQTVIPSNLTSATPELSRTDAPGRAWSLSWPVSSGLPDQGLVGLLIMGDGFSGGKKIVSVEEGPEIVDPLAASPSYRAKVLLDESPETTANKADWYLVDEELPAAYSNFAPIVDIDCGPNLERSQTSEILWSLPGVTPPQRVTEIEFYRTSADQSLVFYRLDIYATVEAESVQIYGTDTLSDEELFDVTRPRYAAVPVILPNGNLNAFRFGKPRTDMASCCAFNDRLWYAGSTSGEKPNSIFYSEYDEFESCPRENELALQNNDKTTDYITCLVPFGSYLLVMTTAHCYGLTFNTDPGVDTAIQPVSNRGCLNSRCWQTDEDLLYVLDQTGVYAMEKSGAVTPISDAIANLFVSGGLDFTKREFFHIAIDHRQKLLRVFCCDQEANDRGPNVALCYSIRYKTWWTESYPTLVMSSSRYTLPSTGLDDTVYATIDGSTRKFSGNTEQHYRGIESINITDGGNGYTTSPKVTAPGGAGAKLEAVVRDGVISEILILSRGTDYGNLAISQAGNGTVGESISWNDSLNLQIDPPPTGNQAIATAIALTPKIASGQYSAANSTIPAEVNQKLTVSWRMKTSNMELISDANTKAGSNLMDRSITLLYKPTSQESILILREYYNNSGSPRENVMFRDRGTGFVHEIDGAQTTLDMASDRNELQPATGIATARFAGRVHSDMGGADRHVSCELSQQAVLVDETAEIDPPLIYGFDVEGVVDE